MKVNILAKENRKRLIYILLMFIGIVMGFFIQVQIIGIGLLIWGGIGYRMVSNKNNKENGIPKVKNQTVSAPIGFLFAFIVGIVIFLLFFHVVSYDNGFSIIPKEHATFSECFVKLDDLLEQYNNRSIAETIRGEGTNLYLIRKLKEKGLIVDKAIENP